MKGCDFLSKKSTILIRKEVIYIARLTNEEIRKMSLEEADAYTDAHPAEAWRFAKMHYSSAKRQTGKALKHGLKAGVLAPNPEIIETI